MEITLHELGKDIHYEGDKLIINIFTMIIKKKQLLCKVCSHSRSQ